MTQHRKSSALVLAVAMLAPTMGLLLTSTVEAADSDIRALAVYDSFTDVPADGYFAERGLASGYRFVSIPAIIVAGSSSAIESLRHDPRLHEIVHDEPVEFLLETAVVSARARDVWGTQWHATSGIPPMLKDGQPLDGRGVTVGIVDSGVNALHPDLWYAPFALVDGVTPAPKVLECVHTTGILGPAVTAPTPNCDENVGHGTHVAGIVAGTGMMADMGFALGGASDYNGLAPGAQLAVAGLGVETIVAGGLVIDGLAGLDWQYATADLYGTRVVTNSWSSGPTCSGTQWNADGNAYHAIVNKLVLDKGITVLWAANNNGGTKPIGTSPQARHALPGVISVANYDDKGTGSRDADINAGSGDGCVKSGGAPDDLIWTFPDVAAPGTNIISTAAGIDGALGAALGGDAPFYASLTGTSMATPAVAGVVALMYQAYPEITPAQVERILIETAKPWADNVATRNVTGTTVYWGPSAVNNAVAGFADPSLCRITPEIAARAEANDPTLDAIYPGFRQMVQPRFVNGHAVDADAFLYVCRDYKRGHGLVDAHAAVLAALDLADGGGGEGEPEVTITSPTEGASIEESVLTVEGLVDREGGQPNAAPLATLSASPASGPSPLEVAFSLAATDTDGSIVSFSLDFGDDSAPLTGATLPTTTVSHTYSTDGDRTATLVVADNEGATATSTVEISVGGLPETNPDVTGGMYAYNFVGVEGVASRCPGVSNVIALGTGVVLSDEVPKYPAGSTVCLSARSVESNDANTPVTLASSGSVRIFDASGDLVWGPVAAPAYDDTDALGNAAVGFDGPDLTIPADWSGRYYLAFAIELPTGPVYISDTTSGAMKPLDIVSVAASGPADTGHTIADADNDGTTAFGELQWADVAVDVDSVRVVMKVAAVPPSPEGTSPTLYIANINGIEFESFLYGIGFGPRVWDDTNSVQVIEAATSWDTAQNLVMLDIPRTYLAGLGADCPCLVHVEAQAGPPFFGGQPSVDRAPDAGAADVRAEWQRVAPAIALGTSGDPENTDPTGDVAFPHVDVEKVWVSRESATEVDITLEVADLASAPPSVDAGNPARASWSYGVDLCVDNAAATYTGGGNFAGVSGVICYRLSAANGVLGVKHSANAIQKDGTGSCGVPNLSKGVVFNSASSTVTWTLDLTQMTVSTIGAALGDCTTSPQGRSAPPPTTGDVLSRFAGRTGFSGPVVTAIVDDSDASAARPYTLGGSAPPLVADAGAGYEGQVDTDIAILGSATGGAGSYACAWSASDGVFADPASCGTSVRFPSIGARTITLTVTDADGATATDTATVDVVGDAVEHVEVVIGGIVRATAEVETSASAPSDAWSIDLDLGSLPNGETDLVATWYDADGTTVLATAQRSIRIDRQLVAAFVDIGSPEQEDVVSGTTLVTGLAGRMTPPSESPEPVAGANAYGLPLASGLNGGRAPAVLDGIVLLPCAGCQPGPISKPVGAIPNAAWTPVQNNAPGQLKNNLATSSAWLFGPDSPSQGLDGYWFHIDGFEGAEYELSDAFAVAQDIRFYADPADPQTAELGANNGETMPKTGLVPDGADWAFVYVRRAEGPGTLDRQTWGEPRLTLTPQVVPPGAVQALAATPGAGTVALAWTAPLADGGELLGYKVLRDGALVTTTATAGFVDAPGNTLTHAYEVIAYNSAGDGPATSVSAAAQPPAPTLLITHPLDGAINVPATTAIAGTYPAGGGATPSAFANTHYVALFNLNDDSCGGPLGYGDHVIFERLTRHAMDALGVPAANIHVYNEGGGALSSSVDPEHYPMLSSSWQSGGEFDGPARWSVFRPALREIALAAAADEAAGGPPARIFFIESSHGLQAPLAAGPILSGSEEDGGATDSAFCLVDTGVTSTMLGDLLNEIDADVASASAGVEIEWSINVDCSFCGGFIDSPLPLPGTTPVYASGVVAPNRVVEVGCTWVTECFGNPAVTYHYMFNECVFTGKADGYGPMVVTGEDGTNGGDAGDEIIIPSATASEPDGVITLEESYWCALAAAQSTENDAHPIDQAIAIQQMFQIADDLDADMFGSSGFVLWEKESSLGLSEQDPAQPLSLQGLALPDTRATDPAEDGVTPFSDLLGLEAAATSTHILAELRVADLTLSSLKAEDVVLYTLNVNGDRYVACYFMGDATLWGADIPSEDVTGEPSEGDFSAGTLSYDTANGIVRIAIPIAELNDETLPAQLYATSEIGDCGMSGGEQADRAPDAGTIQTSDVDDPIVTPAADKVSVSLVGPTTIQGDAELDANTSTWSFQPMGDLAPGQWTATATYLRDTGAGFMQRGLPVSVRFSVAMPEDTSAPTAPGTPAATSATTDSITLGWTASTDNVGVDRYEIVRDGVSLATTSATSYLDTGLAAGTSYSYVIIAYDAAGNSAASAPGTASTQEVVTPVGTVTLRIGQQLLGTAEIDLSGGDSVAWSIEVDWSLVPEGYATVVADYRDADGLTATDSVGVTVSRGVQIDITSPAEGADVLPSFSVSGVVDGAGGPSGVDTSTYMLSDGTVDKLHLGFAMAQAGGLNAADAAFADAPGYLGVAPDLGGAPVVRAYFTGEAPEAPADLLPAGWTLSVVENVELERAIVELNGPLPQPRAREGPPAPSQTSGLGPGTHLFQDRPDGSYGCTANFVWKDQNGEYYLGAAGHCFLPGDKSTTHGPDADYDPRLTKVSACISECTNGGQTGFIIDGTVVPLGPVVYARQATGTAEVGHDFGLVKIPRSLYDIVRPGMPVWNGPDVQGTLQIGEPAVLYGNAAGFGEVWPTMARAGFGGVFGSALYWSAVLPSAPGDSGSALVSAVPTDASTTTIEGYEAIGTLTHLSAAGPVVGTTMARSIEMAAQAGLTIVPVLEGEPVTPPEPTVPSAPFLNTLTPGQTQMGLAWSAPTNDGNSAITGYTIRWTSGSGETGSATRGPATSTTITGLTPATSYTFTVSAQNAVGSSDESNALTASTQAVPTPPTAPRNLAAAPGNNSVRLVWDAPESDGGRPLTAYTVSYQGPTTGSVTTAADERAVTVRGLTNGAEYTFRVAAHNEIGTSEPSAPLVVAPNGPPPPMYTVEVRVDRGETELVPWTPTSEFDGSTFRAELSNVAGGDATVTARVLADSIEVRRAVVAVYVLSPPTIDLPAGLSGFEAEMIEFTPVADDVDGTDGLVFSLVEGPQGASIDSATGRFSWMPDYGTAGEHAVTIRVSDPEGLAAEDTTTVTIAASNRPPVLDAIGNRGVAEGETLSFTIGATDHESDPLVFSATGLPSGATFDPAAATFAWTPSYTQTGNYQVTFSVSDGRHSDSERITISVGDVPLPPDLLPIPPKTGVENALLTFRLEATDEESGDLLFSAEGMPAGATLDAATGVFEWTPTYTQAGLYPVTFSVSDGDFTVSEDTTIEITNVDRAPVVSTLPSKSILQLATLSIPLTATDADGDAITWSVAGPAGMTVRDDGAGKATLLFTPTTQQLGPYTVTVNAHSNALTSSRTATVTVLFKAEVAITPLTPGTTEASPGQAVLIEAAVKNTGPNLDTFRIAFSNSQGWAIGAYEQYVTLGPGETAIVSATVTADRAKPASMTTVTATSLGDSAISRSTRMGTTIPVDLDIVMDTGDVPAVDLPRGRVHVTFRDGTSVAGAVVTVVQSPDMFGASFRTTVTGSTNATGDYTFDLSKDPKAMLPGKHQLYISAKLPGGVDTMEVRQYTIAG